MAKISVDGRDIETKEGLLLIDVLLENGINIPHFCYHKSLGTDGNCRMCMVEIEGQKRPQIACDTPVKDGLIIRTKGEKIEQVKKSILELELINHPIDCPICDQAGECKLQDYYMDVGLYDSRLNTQKQKAKKHEDLGANVMLDQERCVLCTRCVRFTKEITKTNELGVLKRADYSVITTFPGRKLENPYAMNVVDLCPVGALTSKDFRFQKRVWFLVSDKGICDGCSKGCNIYIDHHREKYKDDIIYRYRPRFNEKVNGYFICDKGRMSYKKENENRLHVSMVLGEPKSMFLAIDVMREFLACSNLAFIISPSLSLEEMSMLEKLSKHFKAELIVSTCGYEDESFGDTFLRQNDLALNRRGAKLLGLKLDEQPISHIVSKYEKILFVDIKNLKSALNDTQISYGALSAFDDESLKNAQFVLPMASHTEKIGSFVTSDNFLQTSYGKVKKDNQAPPLTQLCATILNETYMGHEAILEDVLKNQQSLQELVSEQL